MEMELVRHLYPVEEGTFPEVPFDVETGLTELHIQMEVTASDGARATVDLGLRDPFNVRGWSGGARREVTIGQRDATPGYLAGELPAGTWAVLLGAYEVPADGCTVLLRVTGSPESPGWLKGDLHGHSVHSDGSYTLTEIERLVEDAGLDYMGLTDHNTWSQNMAYPRESTVVFIPGMELTTYRGHCNLYGVVQPVDDFRATNPETVEAYLSTAKNRGAYTSLNHPFDYSCPSCHWQWGFDQNFDWVEVWNGPWRESNQLAVQWWHDQIVSGRRLVAVGGSDTHRPHSYVKHGMPTTWVYAKSKTARGILDSIALGHVFISYTPTGPRIDLTCGLYTMGDVVPATELGEVRLTAMAVQDGDIIRIISDLGVEQEHVVVGNVAEFVLTKPSRHFIRVEVYRHVSEVDMTLLAAMSNPLYFNVDA